MTRNEAANQLATLLRQENDALTAGDHAAAARLLPGKQAAAAALRDAVASSTPDRALADSLRALVDENANRLAMAIRVQGRIVELIALAARRAAPAPVRYTAPGRPRSPIGALALTLRA